MWKCVYNNFENAVTTVIARQAQGNVMAGFQRNRKREDNYLSENW